MEHVSYKLRLCTTILIMIELFGTRVPKIGTYPTAHGRHQQLLMETCLG